MKLVSVQEMIAIEKEATELGLSYDVMMENAGLGLAEVILETFEQISTGGIVGLIGSGNNGGDTLVALAELANRGWSTSAYLVKSRLEEDPLIQRFIVAGGVLHKMASDKDFKEIDSLLASNTILLDGIFGTGIKLPLRGDIPILLDHVKEQINTLDISPFIVAVDCPSGIDCDTGEVAKETIPANMTVTMAAVKRGLLQFPAYDYVGDLRVIGIGLPEDGEALNAWRAVQVTIEDPVGIVEMLPVRPANAHKGTFGTALVIAGSLNYTGAALLSGQAAYRIGAGLVTMAIPSALHAALAGQLSEATWVLLPHENGFIRENAYINIEEPVKRATAILIGPGFGLHKTTGKFLSNFFAKYAGSGDLPPCAIDADGLKLLVELDNWWEQLPQNTILTPHPGEMSILTGLSTQEIQNQRIEVARDYSKRWNQIIVLKGAFTVVADPKGAASVIPVATSALASAGTGDVLSGIIVGLLAQGIAPYKAAVSGAWIHAQAGLLAANMIGNQASVVAGDVVEAIIDVMNELIDY